LEIKVERASANYPFVFGFTEKTNNGVVVLESCNVLGFVTLTFSYLFLSLVLMSDAYQSRVCWYLYSFIFSKSWSL